MIIRKGLMFIMKKFLKAIVVCLYILFMIAQLSKFIISKTKKTQEESKEDSDADTLKEDAPVDAPAPVKAAADIKDKKAKKTEPAPLCPGCGTKLHELARFCHNCGIVINNSKK